MKNLYARSLLSSLLLLPVGSIYAAPTAPQATAEVAEVNEGVDDIGNAFSIEDHGDDDNNPAGNRPHHDDGPCSKVKATDAQKAQLKELIFKFKQDSTQLGADLKVARMNHSHAILKDGAVRADVEATGTALESTVGKVISAKMNLKTAILFDVFTAEQRQPVFECLNSMEHRRHGGGHHGSCNNGGHNGGGHDGGNCPNHGGGSCPNHGGGNCPGHGGGNCPGHGGDCGHHNGGGCNGGHCDPNHPNPPHHGGHDDGVSNG